MRILRNYRELFNEIQYLVEMESLMYASPMTDLELFISRNYMDMIISFNKDIGLPEARDKHYKVKTLMRIPVNILEDDNVIKVAHVLKHASK